MTDYEIQGPTRVCAATGRALQPGEKFYGVLVEDGGRFVRSDFAAEAWTGPPAGHVAYWSGRVPSADRPRKPVIDDDLLLDCFGRLQETSDAAGLNFRYVAALLLMRRKRFRFEDAIRDASGRDVLLVRDARGGAVHQVIDPRLTDDQVGAVQAEVFRVLGVELAEDIMRTLKLLLAAAAFTPAVGCKWLDDLRGEMVRPRATGKLPDVAPEQLVGYLNDRASRLQSVEYGNTRMRVSGKGIPIPATLDGELLAAQPRSFRLVSTGRVAAVKLIMGSNDEMFWIYLAPPGEAPIYVYSSHADFENGRSKLPGGIPFEPEWIMQALGMKDFPSGIPYTVKVGERDRTYALGWSAKSPSGQAIRKEVVFDADAALGSRPQVKRHVIRDEATDKVLASAEVKSAETVRTGSDPKSGLPLAIQYPTHVVLRWEEQKFEMDLNLDKAQVNQVAGGAGQFTRPDIRGTTPVDLAKYEFAPIK